MNRNLSVGLLAVLVVCFAVAPNAFGQDAYCAFELTVRTPDGSSSAGVPVAMIRGHNSTFSQTTTDRNGIARICDSPLEPVDIVVGFDVCGSVVIRNLKPSWPTTQRVTATYLKSFCDHMSVAQECQVWLQVQDERGVAIAGAKFASVSSDSRGSDVSDTFGRIFRVVTRRALLQGLVTKEGRVAGKVSLVVTDDAELKVVLPKR